MDADVDLDLDLLVIALESTVKAQAAQLKRQAVQLQRQTQQIARLQRQIDALTPSGVAARDHLWDLHADRFLDRLDAAFARAIGVETLTPGQQQTVRHAFGERVPDQHADPAAYGAFAKRYEASDGTLIDDFLMEYQFGVVVERLLNAQRAVTRKRRRDPTFSLDGAFPRWKMN